MAVHAGEHPSTALTAMAASVGWVAARVTASGVEGEVARVLEELLIELEELEATRAPLVLEEEPLHQQRSASEIEVLRALFVASSVMGRRQVHQQMSGPGRPSTAVRVGQILGDLHRRGLVERSVRPSQGSSKAAFYQLNRQGRRQAAALVEVSSSSNRLPVFSDGGRGMAWWLQRGRPKRAAPHRKVFAMLTSGGVGSTTAQLTDLAARLATRHRVLLVDLDIEGVPTTRWSVPSNCQGFSGLIASLDGPGRLRDLPKQLGVDGPWAFRPHPEHLPGLFVLPFGEQERGEVLWRLCQDAAVPGVRDVRPRLASGGSPLGRIRQALVQAPFDMVLLCGGQGLGPSAWIASMLLADALVLGYHQSSAGLYWLDRVVDAFVWREGNRLWQLSDAVLPYRLTLGETHPVDSLAPFSEVPDGRRGVSWTSLLHESGILDVRTTPHDAPLVDHQGQWVIGRTSVAHFQGHELLMKEFERVAASHIGLPPFELVDARVQGVVRDLVNNEESARLAEGELGLWVGRDPVRVWRALLDVAPSLSERHRQRLFRAGANGLVLRTGRPTDRGTVLFDSAQG